MNPRDVAAAIDDRLERWGRFLHEQGATPLLVLAVRQADRKLVITTVEEIPDEQLAEALGAAYASIAHGRIDTR